MSIELDARIAVEVMGISLIPPRGRALVRVGSDLTSENGTPWRLHNGVSLIVPPGGSLPQPEGTTNFNDRYMAYVAEHSGEDVEALVAAVRDEPMPYSTEMAYAWLVVEKMGDTWFCLARFAKEGPQWRASFVVDGPDIYAETAPEAICLAALKAVEK